MAKLLLSLKCSVNIPNRNGETSYTLMRRNPQVYSRIIQVLIKNGFDCGLFSGEVDHAPPISQTPSGTSSPQEHTSHPESADIIGKERFPSHITESLVEVEKAVRNPPVADTMSSNLISEKVHQIVSQQMAPVAHMMDAQQKEILQMEESVACVEHDLQEALEKTTSESDTLKKENCFYQKLLGLVSRLESAIENVSSLSVLGNTAESASGLSQLGKRKRRQPEEEVQGKTRFRQFVESLIPEEEDVERLAHAFDSAS